MWNNYDSLVRTRSRKAPARSESHVFIFSFSSKLWRGPLWRGLEVWERRTPLRGSRRGPRQSSLSGLGLKWATRGQLSSTRGRMQGFLFSS